MEMTRNFDSPPAKGAGRDNLAPLDWSGLRARFLAARQLRHVLAADPPPNSGSFNAMAAVAIEALSSPDEEGSPGVNPTALGNGKVAAGRTRVVAGPRTAGERG